MHVHILQALSTRGTYYISEHEGYQQKTKAEEDEKGCNRKPRK